MVFENPRWVTFLALKQFCERQTTGPENMLLIHCFHQFIFQISQWWSTFSVSALDFNNRTAWNVNVGFEADWNWFAWIKWRLCCLLGIQIPTLTGSEALLEQNSCYFSLNNQQKIRIRNSLSEIHTNNTNSHPLTDGCFHTTILVSLDSNKNLFWMSTLMIQQQSICIILVLSQIYCTTITFDQVRSNLGKHMYTNRTKHWHHYSQALVFSCLSKMVLPKPKLQVGAVLVMNKKNLMKTVEIVKQNMEAYTHTNLSSFVEYWDIEPKW